MSSQNFGAMLVYNDLDGEVQELYGTLKISFDLEFLFERCVLKSEVFEKWDSMDQVSLEDLQVGRGPMAMDSLGLFTFYEAAKPFDFFEDALLSYTMPSGNIVEKEVLVSDYEDYFLSYDVPNVKKIIEVTPTS